MTPIDKRTFLRLSAASLAAGLLASGTSLRPRGAEAQKPDEIEAFLKRSDLTTKSEQLDSENEAKISRLLDRGGNLDNLVPIMAGLSDQAKKIVDHVAKSKDCQDKSSHDPDKVEQILSKIAGGDFSYAKAFFIQKIAGNITSIQILWLIIGEDGSREFYRIIVETDGRNGTGYQNPNGATNGRKDLMKVPDDSKQLEKIKNRLKDMMSDNCRGGPGGEQARDPRVVTAPGKNNTESKPTARRIEVSPDWLPELDPKVAAAIMIVVTSLGTMVKFRQRGQQTPA